MAQAELTLKQHGFGQTRRRDLWWLQPLAVFTGLSIFVIYSTWAAFQGQNYAFGPYLSPMYSPEIFGESSHSWFGPKPSWWPEALPWSPAFSHFVGASGLSSYVLLLIAAPTTNRSGPTHQPAPWRSRVTATWARIPFP